MSKYITIDALTANPANYTFTRAELLQLSVVSLRQIARAKELEVDAIRQFGDLRKHATWLNALLENQISDEQTQPTEPTCCGNCPLAVDLGNRTKCTAMRKPHGETITYKHFEVTEDCWHELQKARNQEGAYERHHLNDGESVLSREIRKSVNPHALAWFSNWQNNYNWEQQMNREYDDNKYHEWTFLRDQIEQTKAQYPNFEFILIENDTDWEIFVYRSYYFFAVIKCDVVIHHPACSVFDAYYKGAEKPECLVSGNGLAQCIEELLEDHALLEAVV